MTATFVVLGIVGSTYAFALLVARSIRNVQDRED